MLLLLQNPLFEISDLFFFKLSQSSKLCSSAIFLNTYHNTVYSSSCYSIPCLHLCTMFMFATMSSVCCCMCSLCGKLSLSKDLIVHSALSSPPHWNVLYKLLNFICCHYCVLDNYRHWWRPRQKWLREKWQIFIYRIITGVIEEAKAMLFF